jgi:hypothetical protein
MSDRFRDLFNKGRELAGQAGHALGEKADQLVNQAIEKGSEIAGQVRDHAAEKMADVSDGLTLAQLESRADLLNADLTIRRLQDEGWSVDFSNGQTGRGLDFKTAAEEALTMNPAPPAANLPPTNPPTNGDVTL